MPHVEARRSLAAVCLTASLSLLPFASAEASPRERHQVRGREAAPRVEPKPFADSLWQTLVGLWEKVGLVIDGNG